MKNEDAVSQVQDVLQQLESSDLQLARVTEDLIALLIEKQIILFTDLPSVVQEKLLFREKLRSQIRQPIVSIISDDETL